MNGPHGPEQQPSERFTFRSRAYVRFRWTEPNGPDAHFSVAEVITGRYRIEGLLTAGQFTVVLAARDDRTGRTVVLKAPRTDVLRRPDLDSTAAIHEELRRTRHVIQTERRLLVRLRNAGCNAVPVPHDYVHDLNPDLAEPALGLNDALIETEPYLVLQRIGGISLETLLLHEFPRGMDERQAFAIIGPIVDILAHLHEPWTLASGRTWHCVYQDLKPANILVDAHGRPTLLDFGGCQVVIDGTPVLEGSYTEGYGAPECENPARVLLPCADVYGIGSTLHHMLSGIDPRDHIERARLRRGQRPEREALPARCSEGVRDLVARCLAPRPSDRPASARDVARLLSTLTTRETSRLPS